MDSISQALLRELQDRQAIEECVSRYAHALDRHDEALLSQVYHPDARDLHGPFDGPIPEFITWVNALHENKTRAHTHNITTHWCEVRGDRAFADSYVIFVLYLREREVVMMGSGRYIDRLECRSGVWRIAERKVIIDMRFEVPAQPLASSAGGYPSGSWDRRDITYLRPLVLPSEVGLAGGGRGAYRGEASTASEASQRSETSLASRSSGLSAAAATSARSPAAARSPRSAHSPPSLDQATAAALLAASAARRAIKDCITQSLRGLDRADRALTLAQFTPTAHIEDGSFSGSAEQYADQLLARFDQEDLSLTHNLTSHWLDIRGTIAVAETYVTLMRFSKDNATGWVGGLRLLDRLEQHDGRWRIASRQVVADYEFAADGSSVNTDTQYLRGRRDRADISYDRR